MRLGKMIAQGAHASQKVLRGLSKVIDMGEVRISQLVMEKDGPVDQWMTGRFKKIAVRVENEAELQKLFDKAEEAGLPCAMVIDAGLTEFHNVPTKTCIAIGPWWAEDVDRVTGGLKLL